MMRWVEVAKKCDIISLLTAIRHAETAEVKTFYHLSERGALTVMRMKLPWRLMKMTGKGIIQMTQMSISNKTELLMVSH